MELILGVVAIAILAGLGFALLLCIIAPLVPSQRGLTHAAAPLVAAKSLLMWGAYELLLPGQYDAAADRRLLAPVVIATVLLCLLCRLGWRPATSVAVAVEGSEVDQSRAERRDIC